MSVVRPTPMPLYTVLARDGMMLGAVEAPTPEEARKLVRDQIHATACQNHTAFLDVARVMKVMDGAVVFTVERKTELQLKQEMDDALRASADGAYDIFTDAGNGPKFATAYKAWMDLRADNGDRFALDLGYGTRTRRF